jgi:hypothetical protein
MEDEEDWNGLLEVSRYKYSKGAISPGEDQCVVAKSSGNEDRREQEKGCQHCRSNKRSNLSAHETPVIECASPQKSHAMRIDAPI